MARRTFLFFLILTGLLGLVTGFALLWLLLAWLSGGAAGEEVHRLLLAPKALGALLAALLALLALLLRLSQRLQASLFSTHRLAEEVQIIATANPAHRLGLDGPPELQALAQAVNHLADSFQQALAQQTHAVQEAQAHLEEEKERLAALLAELSEGVVVCNLEGQVLLYNRRAKGILEPTGPEEGRGGYLGLGRSIFGLVDHSAIAHGLETVHAQVTRGRSHPVVTFVDRTPQGRFLRVRLAPVLVEGAMQGFVLTLEDITQQMESSSRRDRLVQTLSQGIRASLANIRAAIEAIQSYPGMEPTQRARFQQVIQEEAQELSRLLDETLAEYTQVMKARWQRSQILAEDLLSALERQLSREQRTPVTMGEVQPELWLEVDSLAVMRALMAFLQRVIQERRAAKLILGAECREGHGALLVAWPDEEPDLGPLRAWLQGNDAPEAGSFPSLQEVAERHGGAVWLEGQAGLVQLVLLLPRTPAPPSWSGPPLGESRPEYYDFDLLFRRPSQQPALDLRPLDRLVYTVFDTETTGLDPETDRIISLSGVRIVNGRLLRQEIFDQLVNPGRPLGSGSVAIHGITPEMLRGQPSIQEVLPRFHRFAEETVLVAHNAAFDMRFLQVLEAQTGVRFTNPVLDTLLLSAVVHPHQEDHSLEAIAQRLGIPVIGRHTSLGDAILTAEIFLKLIPILAQKGIHTLGQAREAAEKTYFARIRY